MRKILLSLCFLMTAVSVAFATDDVNLGSLVLGKTYTMTKYANMSATYTATKDGTLTYTTDQTDHMLPYKDATHKEAYAVTMNGQYGAHSYDLNVTAGTTYYFYKGFVMSAANFSITMADKVTVEYKGASPETSTPYQLANGGGQITVNFNKAVTCSSATVKIANNAETSINFRSEGTSLFTNDVQSLVWNAISNGTAKEGDKMVITINGIALTSDASVKYNGDGVLKVEYTLDKKPISILSSENFTDKSNFLSYYSTSDNAGIVKLTFDGKISPDKLVANIRFGDLDKDNEGEYYYETLQPVLSEDGKTVIVNLQGKVRTHGTMLPNATSGTKYDEITLHVAGVMDEAGDYAYSPGQGSLGSYDCIYTYKEITADIAAEFTPSEGFISGNSIEVWIDDESKLAYDGIVFTYVKNDVEMTAEVAKEKIKKIVDPEEPTANILTIPVPSEVGGASKIILTFKNLQCADGKDYNSILTATYTGAAYNAADVNHDGYVNSGDINAVLGVMTGSAQSGDADVNKDGYVNSGDINAILSVMTGGQATGAK